MAVGLLALVGVGLLLKREEAFTLGVLPSTPVELSPSERLCQRPIEASESFSGVRIQVGTYFRPRGEPLELRVLDASSGR